MLPLNCIDVAPVPPDCTMDGLQYMPLYLDRLQRSKAWARAEANPSLAFWMINLWAATWRGAPAGSIEDDDDVVRVAARCPVSEWPEVRGELLRGWLRCEDGRLYQPTVCDLASNVWESREKYRAGLEKARLAKAAKAARRRVPGQGTLPIPPVVVPRPDEHSEPVHETHIDSTPTSFAEREEKDKKSQDVLGDLDVDALFKSEVGSLKKGGEPPSPPNQTRRGTYLDENWEPTAESHLFAQRLGLDSEDTTAAFRDRQAASPRRSPDWQAAFRGWCRGAAERRAPRQPVKKPNPFAWMAPAMRETYRSAWGDEVGEELFKSVHPECADA